MSLFNSGTDTGGLGGGSSFMEESMVSQEFLFFSTARQITRRRRFCVYSTKRSESLDCLLVSAVIRVVKITTLDGQC